MIQWLSRVDPERPFLRTAERVWTYGETYNEVRSRVTSEVIALRPVLDADSVFACLAGIGGGGAVLLGPGLDAPAEADLAGASLVVFTSGTTGAPKGVRLTVDNLEAASVASIGHLGHDESDTWLLAMPLHHVGGLSILIRSAFAGGSVRLLPGFDPENFAAAMEEDVTMVSVVPTMLRRILDSHPGPYEGLRAVLLGGGPIPAGLLERASQANLPTLPTYGMTETFGQVATLDPGSPPARRAHPLPGIQLRIGSDRLIAVRGGQVSPGYLGEPDRTDPWFVTGDLGELDSDGALRILGRADTVIVTGGENVDPARVEATLREHTAIDDALLVDLPDDHWGSVVACLYIGEVSPGEAELWLGQRLPVFMVPKRWLAVDRIPTTTLGKPDRSAARSLLQG
ncbi:MAG: AMP-binding protein [Actinobacteria bacterium]|nr:AMP-binding protein [Actinomycetota bacterium]